MQTYSGIAKTKNKRYGKKSFSYEAAKLWSCFFNFWQLQKFYFYMVFFLKFFPVAHVDHSTPYCIHG